MTILTNPECRDGKCTNCDGRGWDAANSSYAVCPCICHPTGRGGNDIDPNKTLQDLVEKARTIVAGHPTPSEAEFLSMEIAEHVLDLHEWLSKGGFAPAAWKPLIEEIR